jgi:hypothetical protein
MSDFLAPITEPTRYFAGQEELYKFLWAIGLEEKNIITIIHLVARAKASQK